MVELHPHGATGVAHRHGFIESTVGNPQIIEQPQRLPGEVPELRMTALGFELSYHHNRDHDVVLVEAQERPRIREQDGGIKYVGATGAGLGSLYGHGVASLTGPPGGPVRVHTTVVCVTRR